MNKQQEALRLALEALEETRNALAWFYDSYPQDVTKKGNELLPHVETVLAALRAALAEQPAQEPVAWTWDTKSQHDGFLDAHFQFSKPESSLRIMNLQPLYAAPQQAPMQEPVEKMGTYEHKCPNVTGHRGPSFVCQKAGHGVGQNSYCNVCTCPEALNTSPQPAPVQEPIYQCQDSTGKWTDQAKHSYDYNVKHGSATVRVVYTSPQPAQQQEPVAWWDANLGVFDEKYFDQLQPLYTSPPAQRTWVGLTEDEFYAVIRPFYGTDESCHAAMRISLDEYKAIEAKLKEKNT